MSPRSLKRLKRRMLANQPEVIRRRIAMGEHCPAIRAKHRPRNTKQPPIVQVGSIPRKPGEFRSA